MTEMHVTFTNVEAVRVGPNDALILHLRDPALLHEPGMVEGLRDAISKIGLEGRVLVVADEHLTMSVVDRSEASDAA